MLAIRGIFDGKEFKALPDEPLPTVEGEVPVAIVFLQADRGNGATREEQLMTIQRMREARNAMEPIGLSVKDLVEKGRER